MKHHSYNSHPLSKGLPSTGPAIENRSFEIIDATLGALPFTGIDALVVKRIVHATADTTIADTMRIHPEATQNGLLALKNGAPLFCDVRMLQVGITRAAVDVRCAIAETAIIALAKQRNMTRAAAAMASLGKQLNGAIVAVGNAPTAIWKLLELHETQGITPALVVGLPVGFVGAAESKQALWESDLVSITNIGPRGGSSMAAAAVNAIAIAAEEESNATQ